GAGEDARQTYDALAASPAAVDPAAAGPRVAAARGVLPPGVRIATGKPQPMPPSAIDSLIEALPIASARAGERPPDPPVRATPARPPGAAGVTPTPAAASAATGPATAVAPASAGPASEDWRFDMRQDGKAMSADQFDAWMKARRARVATGKAGAPDPYGSAAPAASARVAPETIAAARQADAPPPSSASAPLAAAAPGAGVLLQVAAFGARDNAERALGMLQRAGIQGARVQDGTAAGKPVFRVRVGPVAAAGVAELSARVAGLGFGAPNIVRE
ncbi:MAG TPA: SPOR domain-containing protein, partial [Luteimonas sp.]|nr:SPOR domain-containing protein [Luteimonas sp.]